MVFAAGAKTTPVAVAVALTVNAVPLVASASVPIADPLTVLVMVPERMLPPEILPVMVSVREPSAMVAPETEVTPARPLLPLPPEISSVEPATARLTVAPEVEPDPVMARVPPPLVKTHWPV